MTDELPQTTDDGEDNALVRWSLIAGAIILGIIVLNVLLDLLMWAVGWLLYAGLAAIAAYLLYRVVGWMFFGDDTASTREQQLDEESLDEEMVESASVDDLAQLEHDEETELDFEGSLESDADLEREFEELEGRYDADG